MPRGLYRPDACTELTQEKGLQLKRSYSSCNVIRPQNMQKHLHYEISASRSLCEILTTVKKACALYTMATGFVYIQRIE